MSYSKEKIQLVNELHAPARKNFPRRRVIIKGLDDLWQADLVEMRPYSRFNKGYNYLLTVIDSLSKYAWASPIKQKTGKDVADAFEKILKLSKRIPKNLQVDKGKEFYNKDFEAVMHKNKINMYSTYSVLKASIIERFNRTLKSRMWKLFSLQGSYKWLDILPEILKLYNNTKHRTIGIEPRKVNKKKAKELLKTVFSNIKIAAPGKFKVGDKVRISKEKEMFAKGYIPSWSAEVFTIKKVQRTNPVTYILKDYKGEDIAGGFYQQELQKTHTPDIFLVEKVLERRGKKVFVKWLGFDNSHNSWINANNVL